MPSVGPFLAAPELPLFVDQYELTMVDAYLHEGLVEPAVFSLFCRALPPSRGCLVAAGLDAVLRALETLRFSQELVDWLGAALPLRPATRRWLLDFRFRGDVWAVPEGTPVFADEPLLELEAPLPVAQLVETLVMNQLHLATVVASKAIRVVAAARGRSVLDFGMRRAQGLDAALEGARAMYLAGVDATSDVLAAYVYGLPLAGTQAHSYIQAHTDEREAFRQTLLGSPRAIVLVDTYDTLAAIDTLVELTGDEGTGSRLHGVRLDSGDLATLARAVRQKLDAASLSAVRIYASGGLDEQQIADLVAQEAPIDGFGVGTAMGTATDAPALDVAYKLTTYGERGCAKRSPGKATSPFRKQVFRQWDHEGAQDVLALREESLAGQPLLTEVMRRGERLPAGTCSLAESRRRCARWRGRLPPAALAPAAPVPVEVKRSPRLRAQKNEVPPAAQKGPRGEDTPEARGPQPRSGT